MNAQLSRFTAAVVERAAFLWQHRRGQLALAVGLAFALLCGYLFVELANEITDGETKRIDDRILQMLRRPENPNVLVGPKWLKGAMLDVTALGGPMVLGLMVTAIVGFFFLEGQRRVAWLTILAIGGGGTASIVLKLIFARPRPDIVPHLREVTSASFPSGHAMTSAVVYLTVGVMFMKAVRGPWAKAYVMAWGVLLTVLVGVSRVYLGVHYPSDVLGGWIAGVSWATGCWVVGQFVPSKPIKATDDRAEDLREGEASAGPKVVR